MFWKERTQRHEVMNSHDPTEAVTEVDVIKWLQRLSHPITSSSLHSDFSRKVFRLYTL